jgi:hypothetical protein
MSAAERPLYRVYLAAPIDKRIGMRLDNAVELGSYEPEDSAWLPAGRRNPDVSAVGRIDQELVVYRRP